MDIGSGKSYPANALSNFAPHPFEIDGVRCNSMEGFLQSLKFKNPDMQEYVCTLVGREAKFKGKDKKWWTAQVLYWRGTPIDRHSQNYKNLLVRAYDALSQNDGFKKALLASGSSTLTHSLGKNDPHRTVLTESEFCGILISLRNKLQKGEVDDNCK